MNTLLKNKFNKNIRNLLLITDFDGVWTDNTVMTTTQGYEIIVSSKSDSIALSHFRKAMLRTESLFEILVITSENNNVVSLRNKKLGIDTYVETNGKLEIFQALIKKYQTKWKTQFETVYIGNDFNDISCMIAADISCCPVDSEPGVKRVATKKLSRKGGHGCIREFFEWYAKIKKLNFWCLE